MEIAKAEKVASQFEVAKQFWSYQVKQGVLAEPKTFISSSTHCFRLGR